MDMTLASGLTVTTYSPPPGFNPLSADDADLVKAGFPARPADPKLLARYNRVLTGLKGKLNFITPTFRDEADIVHGPRVKAVDAGAETSTNWSGAVVYAPAGESFWCVEGDWVIPAVDAPTENEWYYAASWVGIDGDGSGDVCQAGIESSVYRSGNSVTTYYYPWFEWYPAGSVAISNFPISPGDLVTCLIQNGGAGSTTAKIYFTNRTTGVSVSFSISAPVGVKLVGNCAEWILEAPTVNGQQSAVADYGQVFFSECLAGASKPGASAVVESGTGDSISLYSGSTELSEGLLTSASVVECLYVGTLP